VPQFDASSPAGLDAIWVGIGGADSPDLIQAGTQQQTTGAGRTQYSAWIETLPQASRTVPLAIYAGDSIAVSLSEQSRDNWLVSFTNNPTGQPYTDTVQYNSSNSSAECVEGQQQGDHDGRVGGHASSSGVHSISATRATTDGEVSAGKRGVNAVSVGVGAWPQPGATLPAP
jgi:hypothetical protein